MSIPIDTDVFDPVVGPEDRDQGNAAFDEAPGLKNGLAMGIKSVPFSDGGWFLGKIEGAAVSGGGG